MNAYELFCRDLMGDELIRAKTDRRAYYNALRQALREELAAGAPCELLEHFSRRLSPYAPAGMYLLDAAAIWECYEATVGGLRFPRDIGQGIPFQLSGGRRLSWADTQRLSDARALPAAALDAELRARLEGLIAYGKAPAEKRAALVVPPVNPRAKLETMDVRSVGAIPAPGSVKEAPVQTAPHVSAQLEECRQQLACLQQERDALRAELARAQSRPQADAEALLQVADMILYNRMAEAAEKARGTGSALETELQRLQELQGSLAQAQEKLYMTREQLQAAAAQLDALHAQQRAADQALDAARCDCEKAQRDAAACLQEKQMAEKALAEAQGRLERANAELRELQRRIARTGEAAEMTRRQADRLG